MTQVRGTFPQAYRLDELRIGPMPQEPPSDPMAKQMGETGAQYRYRMVAAGMRWDGERWQWFEKETAVTLIDEFGDTGIIQP